MARPILTSTPAAACLLLVTALATPSAHAVDVTRIEIMNPLNACHGALPSFEGSLRKRPRGYINEGASPAFVSCGIPAETSADRTSQIVLEFRNEGSAVQTVNCTAVDGRSVPTFATKSVTVEAGTGGNLSWTAADNGGVVFRYPAISCGLPTGVLLRFVDRTYTENVGN